MAKWVLTLWSSMHCVSWKHLEHWLSSCNRPGISCFTKRAASRFRCISSPAMSSADFMMTYKRTRWWHCRHILYCAQQHDSCTSGRLCRRSDYALLLLSWGFAGDAQSCIAIRHYPNCKRVTYLVASSFFSSLEASSWELRCFQTASMATVTALYLTSEPTSMLSCGLMTIWWCNSVNTMIEYRTAYKKKWCKGVRHMTPEGADHSSIEVGLAQ